MQSSDLDSLSDFYSVATEVSVLLAKNQLGDVDAAITEALGILGRFAAVQRAYVFTFDFVTGQSHYDYEWCEEGTEPQIHLVPTVGMDVLADWVTAFEKGEHVYLPSIPEMPESDVKRVLDEQDIKSLIVYPMFHGDDLLGFVGFDAVSGYRTWGERDFSLLKIACDTIGSTLSGKMYREQLLKSMEAAEKANAYKSEFLANMSHELRSPLNSVIGFSELIEHELGVAEEERIREYVGLIKSAGKHLHHLINEVLDLARIETGKMSLEKRLMDMRELLELVASTHRISAKKKGVTLVEEVPAGAVYVEADETRLRQVVHNLLSNAIKFTGHGKRVGLRLSLEGDQIVFEIWDEGRGIPKLWIQKVFEPFEQVDPGDAEKDEGAGLGLAIVKKIVNMHSGTVELESEIGLGSTFRITLPRGDLAQRLPDPQSVEIRKLVKERGRKTRVLCVDDIAANRLLLSYGLSICSFEVNTAINGKEAVSAIKDRERAYDIVLLDIKLPDMSGFEVFEQIRSLRPSLPVIAVTASITHDIRSRIEAAGFDALHGKPIEFSGLIQQIEYCLNRSEGER